jgi:hypothetical protein
MAMKNAVFLNVMACNLVQFAGQWRNLLQSIWHNTKEDYLSQYILSYGLDIIMILSQLFQK